MKDCIVETVYMHGQCQLFEGIERVSLYRNQLRTVSGGQREIRRWSPRTSVHGTEYLFNVFFIECNFFLIVALQKVQH